MSNTDEQAAVVYIPEDILEQLVEIFGNEFLDLVEDQDEQD